MSVLIGVPVLFLILLIFSLGGSDTPSVPGPSVQFDEYGVCSINGGYTPVDCSTGLPNRKEDQ